MKIETRKFGEIDIEKEKIIHMPSGLPGFPGKHRFTLIERKETKPFCWYQSVEDPDLALILISPYIIKPDYSIDIKPILNLTSWNSNGKGEFAVFVVVNASSGTFNNITANLIGPIVINANKREAYQLLLHDSSYSHQYPIIPPEENNSRKKAAG